eukprot:CAMPEP_0119545706 /NCGR_PEP_ID=MMETSP1352-20130426/380_1 /TAXON_ID=265584 /ORGANISM="Stauroneis constricta, Strain CCMP1120" /LENGTH=246 /DNA_ID=CAMNT_0007590291 /DNA_START=267 /DNA_END=1007 /DNA_ORIENTATION=-
MAQSEAFVPLTTAASSPSSSQSKTALAADVTTDKSAAPKRKPWNVFRFVEQSSKFINIIPKKAMAGSVGAGVTIWNSQDDAKAGFTFAPLDDVVMGGASSSTFRNGRWTGEVTDANNGGFIGIRSTPSLELDMSQCKGLKVTLRGDSIARRMKIGLRDNAEFNGIVWNSSFDVPGGKNNRDVTIKLPFNKLIPNRFANTVSDAGDFNTSNVAGIQFVYSKFEYEGALNPKFSLGDIDIEIKKIESY